MKCDKRASHFKKELWAIWQMADRKDPNDAGLLSKTVGGAGAGDPNLNEQQLGWPTQMAPRTSFE
jgi:hypothetical protein